MKTQKLNEEIINQLRLINFDRSKTILEQNQRRVSIEGRIFNGIDGNPCESCNVTLYVNNIDTNKVLNHEYYENKFYRTSSVAETQTTSEGYYGITTYIEPGPYAIIANGATTYDYTTVYFNVVKSGTYNIDIQLAKVVKNLGEITVWGDPKMKALQIKFDDLQKYYNILMDTNWSNNTYNYSFPDPSKFADNINGVKDMKPYVNTVQNAVNELSVKIKKGEKYLKGAKEYVDIKGLKPLDVLRDFGTQNAYTIMHSLYSVGGDAVNLWREWHNNDGQLDTNYQKKILSI